MERREEAEAARIVREQRIATSEARNVAIRRLKAAHPDEYRRYYEEEAVKRGVTPYRVTRERRIARLRAELRMLEAGNEPEEAS